MHMSEYRTYANKFPVNILFILNTKNFNHTDNGDLADGAKVREDGDLEAAEDRTRHSEVRVEEVELLVAVNDAE